MSSLFELVVDGITSFFSPVAAEKDEEKKKKKKRGITTMPNCLTAWKRLLRLHHVKGDLGKIQKQRAR